MEYNKVYNIDFLSNKLPDKCANLIIADPPYFEVKGEFDFIWSSFEEYLIDVEKWAEECKRILADNGTLFWYGDDKRIAYAQIIMDKKFNLINNLVWNKGSFMGLEKSEGLRSFAPCTERILMYSNDQYNLTQCVFHIRDYIRQEIERAKGKIVLKDVNTALGTATNGGGVASACLSLDKSEPTMITKEMYEKLQQWLNSEKKEYEYLRKEYEQLRKEYEQLRKEYEQLRSPFNNTMNLQEVLNFSNEAQKTGSKYLHDTVKPETMTRALIQTCSRKGDLVVVPFAGSGTECAMSAKEKRNFIGFDINPNYVEMANRRSKKILNCPTLF
jgi:site-specific DNA-methyltransferase (adenine-specific)